MKKKLNIEITGLNEKQIECIHNYLIACEYEYTGNIEDYDDIPAEWGHIDMLEYIKTLDKEQMQKFIYWVYLCGNCDGRNGREDSPGECSFFGGDILNRTVADVVEGVNDSYGFDWR